MVDRAAVWRDIIREPQKVWVLFEHGTCVILMAPEDDIRKQAQELIAQYGPVYPGSSAGDFNVVYLEGYPGWAVLGHHPDILNYVAPEEVDETDVAKSPLDLYVGMLGRNQRDQDGRSPNIVYVHDPR